MACPTSTCKYDITYKNVQIRCFHRLQFNCIHIDWCSGAKSRRDSRGVTEGQAPGECGARRRTEGRANNGRSWKLANNSGRSSTCIANSDIRIFRIHFWQALCKFTAF